MLISSSERYETMTFMIIIGLGMCSIGLFCLNLYLKNYPSEILLIFVILAVFYGLFIIRHALRLRRVELFDSHIRVTGLRKTIDISLDKIEGLKYYSLLIMNMTEEPIKIKLTEKTELGRTFIFLPSSLTNENEFKFNREIKNLLERKVHEIKNTRANNAYTLWRVSV